MGYDSEQDQHYLDLLKGSRYSEEAGMRSVVFGYQSPEQPQLQQRRSTYDLDHISGEGPEVDRLLCLMAWVHRSIKYDGGSGCYMPPERNALHILAHPLSVEKGVNCRMIAIVLNDVLLAMGWRSRFVTCLPHDVTDQDCHVVTSAFVRALGRWVMLDPSFNAYFTDEHGHLLGLQDVRAAMCSGSGFAVSEGAALNPGPGLGWWDGSDVRAVYRGYMSKNLFRMECSILSEFNYESAPTDRVYVSLQCGGPLCQDSQSGRAKQSAGSVPPLSGRHGWALDPGWSVVHRPLAQRPQSAAPGPGSVRPTS